ncbi:MAG: ferritin-like domain-containing protein [Candidatus Aenigmarchaeota archaeon]|nr:ferritin-like domain-containing protein [Candidatus Aenigmarchaeota archaeon]
MPNQIPNGEKWPVLSPSCDRKFTQYIRLMDINEQTYCDAQQGDFETGAGRLGEAIDIVRNLYSMGAMDRKEVDSLTRVLRGYRGNVRDRKMERVEDSHDTFNRRIRPSLIDDIVSCEISARIRETRAEERPVISISELRKRRPAAVPPSGRSYQRMDEDIDQNTCLKAIARTSQSISDEQEAITMYEFIGENALNEKMKEAFNSAQKDEMRHKAMFQDVLKSLLQECVTVTRR